MSFLVSDICPTPSRAENSTVVLDSKYCSGTQDIRQPLILALRYGFWVDKQHTLRISDLIRKYALASTVTVGITSKISVICSETMIHASCQR